jgi:hypothetical protein
MRVELYKGNILDIAEIAYEWRAACNANDFGIYIDDVTYFKDLERLIESDTCALLVLYNDTKPVGYIGIVIINSPLDNSLMAIEHYWYVMKEYRGFSSIKLLKAAQCWAKQQGCSHIIFNASNAASDSHDDICKLYELLHMKKFETSYIYKL